MKKPQRSDILAALVSAACATCASAGQAPGSSQDPDRPISHRDRVYAAEQFSNTVSVTDPANGRLLGVIRLGDTTPTNVSPLYRGQLLVHGMGFSPDHRTIVVVSIGSNSVTFIDTATNQVKHTAYVGRSPHEAFFTPDGTEVWVTVRGESHVSVIDAATYAEKMRLATPNGPGMTIFSPDGRYGYVCSSFVAETVVFDVRSHRVVGHVAQDSPFCPNIAATPDGSQVWMTLKDSGRTMVFDARPPFTVLARLDTGPITNHVNFARTARGQFAYVTVGGLNVVKVFRTDADFAQVATIPVGDLPHGLWPSGDGSRIYVGLENGDAVNAIDTATNQLVATIPIGQGPQALVYVPDAVPQGPGLNGLQPLSEAGRAAHLALVDRDGAVASTVSLFDQGPLQILQASVTGLVPKTNYVLGLARMPDGQGPIQALATFTTNAAGAAIVDAVGPIRQLVAEGERDERRYLVVSTTDAKRAVVQVQSPSR